MFTDFYGPDSDLGRYPYDPDKIGEQRDDPADRYFCGDLDHSQMLEKPIPQEEQPPRTFWQKIARLLWGM